MMTVRILRRYIKQHKEGGAMPMPAPDGGKPSEPGG
jgi:hypothetical protein